MNTIDMGGEDRIVISVYKDQKYYALTEDKQIKEVAKEISYCGLMSYTQAYDAILSLIKSHAPESIDVDGFIEEFQNGSEQENTDGAGSI